MGLRFVFIVGAFCLLFGTNIGSVVAYKVQRAPMALVQVPASSDSPGNIEVPVPGVFSNPGQLVLAVLYLLGTAFNAWITLRRDKLASQREERNRQWAKEDAAAVAQVAKDEAANLRQHLEDSKKQLSGEIAENTQVSRTALDAANNVNAKIAAVGALRRSNSALRREADRYREADVLDEMHKIKDSTATAIVVDASDPEKRG